MAVNRDVLVHTVKVRNVQRAHRFYHGRESLIGTACPRRWFPL